MSWLAGSCCSACWSPSSWGSRCGSTRNRSEAETVDWQPAWRRLACTLRFRSLSSSRIARCRLQPSATQCTAAARARGGSRAMVAVCGMASGRIRRILSSLGSSLRRIPRGNPAWMLAWLAPSARHAGLLGCAAFGPVTRLAGIDSSGRRHIAGRGRRGMSGLERRESHTEIVGSAGSCDFRNGRDVIATDLSRGAGPARGSHCGCGQFQRGNCSAQLGLRRSRLGRRSSCWRSRGSFGTACGFHEGSFLAVADWTGGDLVRHALRITALLIALGQLLGLPEVALGGFHSQAGWITFNLLALGLGIAARCEYRSFREPRPIAVMPAPAMRRSAPQGARRRRISFPFWRSPRPAWSAVLCKPTSIKPIH